ncbi:MAG TPA: YciI family protein [Dermatophilaceae bacterium]|nr:YciI family protein [Dermatophilaceae bacterium]
MALYAALTYTADVDWTAPEHAPAMAEYVTFSRDHGDVIKGGAALYPTSTATVVRVKGARGGDVVTADGPYAETKEALTGFYLIEASDLDDAVKLAAEIPAAWAGAVEVRPVIAFD